MIGHSVCVPVALAVAPRDELAIPASRRTPVERALTALSWLLVAVAGGLAAGRALGIDRTPFPALEAGAPAVYVLLVPVLVLAAAGRRRRQALVVGALLLGHLGWLGAALPGWAEPAPSGERPLRVLSANLNQYNAATAGTAGVIARHRPDLVLLLEWSPVNAPPLLASGVLEDYPYRVERPDARGSDGVALFSRLPLTDVGVPVVAGRQVVLATVDGRVRFAGVHTHSPTTPEKAASWRRELRLLPDLLLSSPLPLVVAGDFNATSAHRRFTDLLDRAGLADAHDAVGAGWTRTWPAGGALPALVRPDHVLVGPEVRVERAWAGWSSGSDHRPVLADLVLTRP